MENRSVPAKVSRPLPSDSYPRPRLFRELDRAWRKPLIWITGAPGSGKTTLVTDFLARKRVNPLWYQLDAEDDTPTFFHYLNLAVRRATPRIRRPLPRLAAERSEGLERFATDFFLEVYARLKPPFAMVLDNYQDLPDDSPLHATIRQATERLPPGGHLIVISRYEPHAEFARARLNEQMALVRDSHLRFTVDETRGLIRQRRGRHPPPVSAAELHAYTRGWAAGLTLMLKQQDEMPADNKSNLRAPGVLFDYFASEVLNKLDPDTQTVLLSSALLPTMTARLVAELSGERRAGRILNKLSRNHFFTLRLDLGEPEYQYHPLFREFLLSRIRRLPPLEIAALRRRAAGLLETGNASESALWLYRDADAWSDYTRCLQKVAPELLNQGRLQALDSWLSLIPPDTLERSPWMQYWKALCRLPHDPADSRVRFEAALDAFEQSGDAVGARLSWCGGVNAIQYGARNYGALHEWVDRFGRLPDDRSGSTAAAVTASMLTALVFSDPSRPDAARWIDQAARALDTRSPATDAQVVGGTWLLVLELFRGHHVRADQLVKRLGQLAESPRITASNRILARVASILHAWLRARTDDAVRLVDEARTIADETGVRLWDSHLAVHAGAAALTTGDTEMANEWLDQVERNLHQARGLDLSFFYYLLLWRALLRGEPAKALENTRYIGTMAFTSGLWFADALQHQIQAIAWLQAANPDQAGPHIDAVREIARRYDSHFFSCQAGLLDAQRAIEEHRDRDGRAALANAFSIARLYDIVNFPGWLPTTMSRLAARALEWEIEAPFIRTLIQRRALAATDEARDLESWPWPIRIYTFGRVAIVRDDQPVVTQGRAPSRPIELLVALLAEGGRGVHEERLCEMLWPDSEGDAAHRAFDTTLHRLRRLLGYERSLMLSDGKLSVNPMLCWVDTWSFERQLGRIELLLKSTEPLDGSTLNGLAERLHGQYRGPFLGRDSRAAWVDAPRARLRDKYMRLLSVLARRLEESGEWSGAANCYEKAIDIQPETREYLDRLGTAYRRLGRNADADALARRHDPIPADSMTDDRIR